MSDFKVGDVVKVVKSPKHKGNAFQPVGAVGAIVDIHRDGGYIVQFSTRTDKSGWGCSSRWDSPTLCCEWFCRSKEQLELTSPQNPLDIPGYVPPDGWRIKADDEMVGKEDAYSHDTGGRPWSPPLVVGKYAMLVATLRADYLPSAGYILTPIPVTVSSHVVKPEPAPEPEEEVLYIFLCGSDDLEYETYTKADALAVLTEKKDGTVLYRCLPVAKKISQITMIGDNE